MDLEVLFMERISGRKLLKNKKGSILDLIFIGVFCLVFAFMILIGFKITTEINTQVQGMADIPVEAKTASSSLLGEYTGSLDYGFLFFFVGLSIGVLILAAMVRIHPIFIALYIVGLVFVVFFAGIFSNIYQEMADSAEFTALSSQLVMIDKVMTFLPLFVAVVGTLLCVIMYKSYEDGLP